jgi:hypothetical protein
MERRWPELFSRPEVQLNLIQQNNVTENHLSITITPEEIREIEAEAAPSREKVRKMFEEYQLRRSNGNGEGKRTVDVQAETVKEDEPTEKASAEDAAVQESVRRKFASYRPDTVPEQSAAQPPIVRKDGDENSPAFWNQFVSGDGQRTVEKTTAVFAVKAVVCESVGPRFASQPIAFGTEPITVADVLATIEKLSGPAWLAVPPKKDGVLSAQGDNQHLYQQLAFL